jgi:hypothetical protein
MDDRPRYFVVSRDVPAPEVTPLRQYLPADFWWPEGWPQDWAKVEPHPAYGFVLYAPANYDRWSLESVHEQCCDLMPMGVKP